MVTHMWPQGETQEKPRKKQGFVLLSRFRQTLHAEREVTWEEAPWSGLNQAAGARAWGPRGAHKNVSEGVSL